MKKFLFAIVAVSAAVWGATSVVAQQARPALPMPAAQTCLQIDRVDSWNIVNSRTMVVTDRQRHKYRVALNGNCAHSQFYDKVIFRPFATASMGCIKAGDRVTLSNRQGGFERCYIREVSPYTDEQLRVDRQARPGSR